MTHHEREGIRTYTDIYGHIRTYTDVYGHIRTYTDIYGHMRTYTDIYGHIRTYTDIYGQGNTTSAFTSTQSDLRATRSVQKGVLFNPMRTVLFTVQSL